jgi:hypothetical protein
MQSDAVDNDTRIAEAAALKLLFDAQPLGQAVFGRRFDIGGQSMVSQYLTGRRPLNLPAAINFARGLQRPIAAFSPRLAALAAQAASTTPSNASLPSNEAGDDKLNLLPVLAAIAAITPGQWVMVRARLDSLPGHPEACEDIAEDVLPMLMRRLGKRHAAG